MKKLLIIILSIFLFAVPCLAANNVIGLRNSIEISSIDSDWNDTEYRYVKYIIFVPGATDDILVIRQASTTGPTIVYMKSSDGYPRIAYPLGTEIKMFLDYADSTLTAGSQVIILLGR